MKSFLQRMLFVLLSAAAMVFFSEKVYWYVQGYVIWELVLYYALPVYACIWAIDQFRARGLAPVILVGALYAFLVEGALTPVLYEAGLLDPVMPAYFIGWHGLISLVFGWYLLRKWLVTGAWRRVLSSSVMFGLFWGSWALTFWLPETIAEFEQLAAQGEPAIPGAWPAVEFGLNALTFTAMLALAHWLLGRGAWVRSFRSGRAERWLVTIGLAALFGLIMVPVAPLAFIKLAALLGVIVLALRAACRHAQDGSLLAELQGPVNIRHTLLLFSMPVAATLVYALAAAVQPPEESLRLILEITPLAQAAVGAVAFVWAVISVVRRRVRPQLVDARQREGAT